MPASAPARFASGPHFARRLAPVLALAALALLPACRGRRAAPLFSPASAARLDAPDRDAWQKPRLLIETMRITPGMHVMDLGAGTGYMLPWLSRAVGPQGRVYAVEVQPEFVQMLQRRVAAETLANVTVLQSSAIDIPPTDLLDRVLLLDTYRELEEPVTMLQVIKRRLKPTGRVVVIDARPDETIAGPPIAERVEEETVEAEARGAGLVATLRFDILERQYFLMFVNFEEIEPLDPDDPDRAPQDTDLPGGVTTESGGL